MIKKRINLIKMILIINLIKLIRLKIMILTAAKIKINRIPVEITNKTRVTNRKRRIINISTTSNTHQQIVITMVIKLTYKTTSSLLIQKK